MKSIWSALSGLCFVLGALCSPPGFSCPIKSRSSQASDLSRGTNPRKRRARNVRARPNSAIRGRRAQTARPCPRLLIFNPFGVRTKNVGLRAASQSRRSSWRDRDYPRGNMELP
jgi:hypothetical protein